MTLKDAYDRVYAIREVAAIDDPATDPIEALGRVELLATGLLEELHAAVYQTSSPSPSP